MPTAILDADYQKADAAISGRSLSGLQYGVAEAIAREREQCAQAAEWYSNVERFTAAEVAARIRSGK